MTTTTVSSPTSAPGAIYTCMLRILRDLHWPGEDWQVQEALVCHPDAMTLDDLIGTMANLGYVARRLKKGRVPTIADVPCLFAPTSGAVTVLVDGDDGKIVESTGGQSAPVILGAVEGIAVSFAAVSDEESLNDPQPDWFFRVTARFRTVIIGCLLLSLVLSVLALIGPIFIRWIYGLMAVAGTQRTHLFWIGGVAIYAIISAVFRVLRSSLMGFLSVRIGYVVDTQVIRRLLYLSPSYVEGAPLAAQLARLRDFETLREFIGGPAAAALLDLPFVSLLVIALVVLGGSVAIVPVTAIALFLLIALVIIRVGKRVNAKSAHSAQQRRQILMETIDHLLPLRYSDMVTRWLKRFVSVSSTAALDGYRSAKVRVLTDSAAHFLSSGAALATLLLGTSLVLDGQMSRPALMASVFLTWRILGPFRSAFSVLAQVDKLQRSVEQLNRFMALPIESRPASVTVRQRVAAPDIEFDQVAFRYSSDAFPALIGVSFKVDAGKTLAIIGHDQAGKSTILKTLLAMYTPQIGRILVNGSNVRQELPIELRRSIAYAPQEVQLFQGSVADNLRLGNATVSDADIERVLGETELLTVVKNLSSGTATPIDPEESEDHTSNFLRRLVLARAFLRSAPTLLLDEPERGLSSSRWLAKAIRQRQEKQTIFLATTDRKLMAVADHALWLDHGRLRMFGTSAEVISAFESQISSSQADGQ